MNHYQQQLEDHECSSGCESGWTVYLDHSSLSAYDDQEKSGGYLDGTRKGLSTESKMFKNQEEEEEDEDLSMVSDASSGPPHLYEDTNACFYHNPTDGPLSRNTLDKKKKNKNKTENRRRRRGGKVQDQSFLLDDTASSSFLGFSNKTESQPSVVKNVLEYSLGYSTTQFEVRQPYQEHYDFFHSAAPSGNQIQQNQWLEGKRW